MLPITPSLRGSLPSLRAKAARKTLAPGSSRQFSARFSPSASTPFSPNNPLPSRSTLRPTARLSNAPLLTKTAFASSVRFNSTTDTSSIHQPPTAPIDNPFAAPSPSNYDFIAEQTSDFEPYIGWLRDAGVNQGWGPSSMMQWIFEHIQVYSGLPWIPSIMATALAVRLSLLWLNVKQADTSARFTAIKPEQEEITLKMKKAMMDGDKMTQSMYQRELIKLRNFAGVKVRWLFLPIFSQIFMGYGMFRTFHHLAEHKVGDMATGGVDWITDLTLPDPAWILPITMSALFHLTMRFGSETGGNTASLSQSIRVLGLWVFPVISFVIMCQQPAGLQVYFITTSVLAVAQGQLLKRDNIRSFVGIMPMPKTGKDGQVLDVKGERIEHRVGAVAKVKGFFRDEVKDVKQVANDLAKWAYNDESMKKEAAETKKSKPSKKVTRRSVSPHRR